LTVARPSSDYVVVARVDEIPPGGMRQVTLDGHGYLIVHADDGVFYAVDELCSHEDFSLSYGCVKDGWIKCSLHGSRFRLATGEPMEEPADTPIGTYPVRIVDGEIRIDPSRRLG
jgi:3-phenylpropionate/trans-cinnamate dioxygenase ferredoxin subunit